MEHKYFILYNNVNTEVFPKNTGVGYKIKGSKDGVRIREKLTSEIKLTSGNGYELIKSLEDTNPELILIVKRKISGVFIERVRSFFYPKDCEYDNDQCFIKVVCEAYDNYTNILLNWENKVNLLSAQSFLQPVNANIVDTDFEYMTVTVNFVYIPGSLLLYLGGQKALPVYVYAQEYNYGNNWHMEGLVVGTAWIHNPNIPDVKGWQVKDIVINLDNDPSITPIAGSTYNSNNEPATATITYYRQVAVTFKIDNISIPPDNSGNWNEDLSYNNSVYGVSLSKWGRYPYLDSSAYNFIQRIAPDTYLNTLHLKSPEPININFTYGSYWRSLTNVMNTLLSHSNSSLTFSSQLLKNNTSPLTGVQNEYFENSYTFTKVVHRELYFAAISDVKQVPQSTERAWKQFTSLKDIVSDLCIIFDADWHIEGNNFIIENIEFYRNGFKYPLLSTTQNVIDLSNDEKNKLKNKYKYNVSGFCHFEDITIPNSDSLDFLGVDIIYNSKFKAEKQIVKTHAVINITTDLANVYIGSSRMPNDGFCLAVIEDINESGQPHIVRVVNAVGKLTGNTITNGLLSVSTLEENFYKYYRPFASGALNLITQNFLSVAPNKEQSNIKLLNCANDFNSNNRIKTELGVGEVNEYEEDLNTGEITLSLLHQ